MAQAHVVCAAWQHQHKRYLKHGVSGCERTVLRSASGATVGFRNTGGQICQESQCRNSQRIYPQSLLHLVRTAASDSGGGRHGLPACRLGTTIPLGLPAALVMSVVTVLAIVCCKQVSRKFPRNFTVLAVFTTCEGLLLGCACSK